MLDGEEKKKKAGGEFFTERGEGIFGVDDD